MPDPEMPTQNWERRFVADAARAAEAVRLYEELGYQVRLVPAGQDVAGPCEACHLATALHFQVIYTRRPE